MDELVGFLSVNLTTKEKQKENADKDNTTMCSFSFSLRFLCVQFQKEEYLQPINGALCRKLLMLNNLKQELVCVHTLACVFRGSKFTTIKSKELLMNFSCKTLYFLSLHHNY